MRLFILSFTFFLNACATKNLDDYTRYKANKKINNFLEGSLVINLDYTNSIDFRGIYDANNSVGNIPIMYSGAAGIGGFFAQVMTHAAMSSSAQNSKLSAQQLEANKKLVPLQNILTDFKEISLIHKNEHYVFLERGSEIDQIFIESNPIFYLSQDLSCITLKHKIQAFQPKSKKAFYQNMIEVISAVLPIDNSYTFLKENNGEQLKAITTKLYQESLSLAVSDLKGQYNTIGSTQKSFRFYQGGKLRIERGSNLYNGENKNIIRNLRGWIISYPHKINVINSKDVTKL